MREVLKGKPPIYFHGNFTYIKSMSLLDREHFQPKNTIFYIFTAIGYTDGEREIN